MKLFMLAQYNHAKIKAKYKKLKEFWQMYILWCKELDKAADRILNEMI